MGSGRCKGTPEGDAYSFAVILYEIHGRKGPYGDLDLAPKGWKMFYVLSYIYKSIISRLTSECLLTYNSCHAGL